MGQGRLLSNRSPSGAAVPANAKAERQPRHDDRPRCGLPRLAVEWAAGFASAFQPTRLESPDGQIHYPKRVVRCYNDAQAGMPLAEAAGAICVQRFDDSRNSAIHTTYRISLRSSSLREPRYPLLRVVFSLFLIRGRAPEGARKGSVFSLFLHSVWLVAQLPRKGQLEWETPPPHSPVCEAQERPPSDGRCSPATVNPARTPAPEARARPPTAAPRDAAPQVIGEWFAGSACWHKHRLGCVSMILPQVHLRKPCYDFSFL